MFFDTNRFHILVQITWQFSIFSATQQIFPIFSNYVPKFKCGNGEVTSSCDVYNQCSPKNITFVDVAFESAALEYKWFCNSYHGSYFTQIQYTGVLIGTILFGTISDAIGRRPVSIFVLTLGIMTTASSACVLSITLLFVLRFFVGLSIGGTVVVVYTYVMEMLLPKQRMTLRGFFNWGIARFILTLICWMLPEWRRASIGCALSTLPALLLILFVLPESPTWLHSKGNLEGMRQSEMHIAKVAGIEYIPVEHDEVVVNKSLSEVLRTKSLLPRLSVLWLMWFVACICSYATDLNSNTIYGNLYVNQVVYALLITLSKWLLVAVDTYVPNFSRRTLHQGAQFIVCVCFSVLTLLTIYGYTGYVTLIVNVTGTVFIEYTWDACYLCAIESMETSCRASATGTCSLVARVGSILAPMIGQFSRSWPPLVYLTVVLLGLINLIVSCLFLHETKHVNLDTVGNKDNELEMD